MWSLATPVVMMMLVAASLPSDGQTLPESPAAGGRLQALAFPGARIFGRYQRSALGYLRHGLLSAAKDSPPRQRAKYHLLVQLVDRLSDLDWSKSLPEHQKQAADVVNSLAAAIASSDWQYIDGMWPVARRLVMGTLLQAPANTSRAPGQLQAAVDQLLRTMYKKHLKDSAGKGAIHFMHVSKSAGGAHELMQGSKNDRSAARGLGSVLTLATCASQARRCAGWRRATSAGPRTSRCSQTASYGTSVMILLGRLSLTS